MPAAEEKPIQHPEPQTGSSGAKVRDKRVLPEGVVPRQAQAYVVAGLALLILAAALFSKNRARTMPKPIASSPAAVSNSANQQRIQELEQDLSADQRQSERPPDRALNEKPTGPASGKLGAAQAPVEQPRSPVLSPRDPIADAERELAFKARFASNLVAPVNASAPVRATKSAISPDSPGQRVPVSENHTASLLQQHVTDSSKHAPEVSIDLANGRPYVIFQGTTIDTVLTNRLDSDFAGPVKVMVTNPVYSRDDQHVLIPAGTFILGRTNKVGSMGQSRLAMTFQRMIMPDGYSVDLDQFRGLDQIGDTGIKDKVNNHYLKIFGASIALGVIAGATESTTYGGYTESGSDMYRQGMASSLSQSSANVLDRFLSIPPAITIREGHRIKVFLTQDLLLPAYESHEMPEAM